MRSGVNFTKHSTWKNEEEQLKELADLVYVCFNTHLIKTGTLMKRCEGYINPTCPSLMSMETYSSR